MHQALFLVLTLTLWVAGTSEAFAAKRKLTINAETPEGAMLQALSAESDTAKKQQMMEDFAAKYPSHESATWVMGELQSTYLKASEFDRAIAMGEKVLASDPSDVAVAESNLKAAEGKKDPEGIKKWATAVHAAAGKVAAGQKPDDEDDDHWKAVVDYAKQAAKHSEYTLFLTALSAPPAQRITLGETLEQLNPKSEYLASLRPALMGAYQQSGNAAKALAAAEAGLKDTPDNDDLLLYAASRYYEAKDTAKATEYAKRLVTTLPAKTAPQGVAEADWAKAKGLKLGIGHWMLGVMASNSQNWTEADSNLRAALPGLAANKDLQAETLFHLGLANYRLGDAKKDKAKVMEGLKFNQQCALIASPFQAQAKKNVAAIKSQYHIP